MKSFYNLPLTERTSFHPLQLEGGMYNGVALHRYCSNHSLSEVLAKSEEAEDIQELAELTSKVGGSEVKVLRITKNENASTNFSQSAYSWLEDEGICIFAICDTATQGKPGNAEEICQQFIRLFALAQGENLWERIAYYKVYAWKAGLINLASEDVSFSAKINSWELNVPTTRAQGEAFTDAVFELIRLGDGSSVTSVIHSVRHWIFEQNEKFKSFNALFKAFHERYMVCLVSCTSDASK